MDRQVEKICPWCGTKFNGTPNQKYCSDGCKNELMADKKKWKKDGYRYKTDIVIMKHRESLVKHKKVSLSRKELKPVHVSSSSVCWRYVNVR